MLRDGLPDAAGNGMPPATAPMWGVAIATVGTFGIVAIRINRRRYMHIGIGIHTPNNRRHHRHGCPLSLAYGQRRGARHRHAGIDPTELLKSVRLVIYRPTGACNAGAHHPPAGNALVVAACS